MRNLPVPKYVRVDRLSCCGFSSTENREARPVSRQYGPIGGGAIRSNSADEAVVAMGFGRATKPRCRTSSRVRMTERNESVRMKCSPLRNPNGKDKLKARLGLLLKEPNASRMKVFADGMCQQSAPAAEQVMDRGAECAAGGCDVI